MIEYVSNDIKNTLEDILRFVGADQKYAEYAQLQSWLENLIKRNQQKEKYRTKLFPGKTEEDD